MALNDCVSTNRNGALRMKLSVLALDYDGPIALNDCVPPSVLDAIADARRRNVTVILVAGRILDDLRRVAGDV